MSSVYERGWRQSFAFSGFPGPDTEFKYAMEYLKPAYGTTLVDMSCGTGLFTRRFVSSGEFKSVIAADYSESMLKQTRDFLASRSIQPFSEASRITTANSSPPRRPHMAFSSVSSFSRVETGLHFFSCSDAEVGEGFLWFMRGFGRIVIGERMELATGSGRPIFLFFRLLGRSLHLF